MSLCSLRAPRAVGSAHVWFAVSLAAWGCGGARPRAPGSASSASSPSASPSASPSTPSLTSTPPSSPQVAAAARELLGRWRCTGEVFGPDGPSPSTATLEATLVLGGAWLVTELSVVAGKYPYQFIAYRTFEPSSQSWVTFIADNLGGHATSRSADGVTWLGTSSSPMKIRDAERARAPSQLDMLGQYSLDGGVTWSTGYELSCAKRDGADVL